MGQRVRATTLIVGVFLAMLLAYGARGSTAGVLRANDIPTIVGFDFPEISGDTSAAGNLLTVSDGTWTGSPTFTYKWQRCNSTGGSCADISGATSHTYTTQAGDLGHVLDAVVTATNGDGFATASAATFSPIGAPAIVGFDFPTISGDTSAAGNLLTVSSGTWSGSPTITYQWQRCDSTGNNCSNISGATSHTYTTQAGDLGHVLDANVTATNANGSNFTIASTFFPLGAPAIVDFDFPSISGDPGTSGNVITVSTGTWSGSPTFTYQWAQCDVEGFNCVDIPGATSNTYTVQAGDLGHELEAVVTATNAFGTLFEEAFTAPAGLPEIVSFDFPVVSGDTTAVGSVLTVSQGTWSESPTSFGYQWGRCDANASNCVDIAGATSSTYTTQNADLGHILQAVVTATNTVGSTTALADTVAVVGAPAIVGFAFPTISGDVGAVGNVLTVSNGTWSGSPTSFTYEWSRCNSFGFSCNPIAGATAHTYTIQAADIGHVLETAVTAVNANGSTTETVQTAVVGVPHIVNFDYPAITGDQSAVGNLLTTSTGTWSGSPTFAYEWDRCDANGGNCVPIGGATATTYTTQAADLGDRLEAAVTATNTNGSATQGTWTEFAIGAPEFSAVPRISGDTGAAGNVLSVTNGTWTGSPTFAYQWQRCDTNNFICSDIVGATDVHYTIQNADLGHQLEVVVTATNANGSTIWDAETQFAVGAPQLAGAFPTITGNPTAAGNTISVTSGTWIGANSIGYQWSRCNADFTGCTPIAGQTASSYQLTGADIGHIVDVTVTATNTNGSSFADASALAGAPFNVTLPQISGDVSAVGNTLTVSNGTWLGTPTFARRWFRCDATGFNCTVIAGATGATYTLADADVGHTLFAEVTGTNHVGATVSDTVNTVVVGTGASQHLLTVSLAGAGAGTVTSSPDGIVCGGECLAEFSSGTAVILTPVAATGSTFTGWSGGGCTGTGACSVTVEADTTVTASFALTPSAPTIASFNPTSAGAHATVTVTGTNLTFTTAVTLGGVPVPFHVVSATTLTFTVPAGSLGGHIAITTTSGNITSAGTLGILQPPAITSIGPGSGPAGTLVTITGTNLGSVVGVEIGHIVVVPTSVSATTVTFVVPPGATSGTLTVLSPAGSATSVGTFTVT